ncbi:ankyrin repeat-containing domain, PGG domain protein [Tanacetum coccineum]
MVASSSNPSFIVEIGEEYPSPSHVYTPILVTVKLSGKDRYNAWKTQILCLLTSHNMLGFINGKVVRPEGNVQREKAWMRSDSIVKSLILGTLSEEVTLYVLNRRTYKNPNEDFTAKDVWDELECVYGPESKADHGRTQSVVTSDRGQRSDFSERDPNTKQIGFVVIYLETRDMVKAIKN